MPSGMEMPRTSLGEEIANSVTHGVGGVLAVVGLAVLVTFAALRGTAWHIVGCSIFGASLVLLYTISTLYHSIPSPRAGGAPRLRPLGDLPAHRRHLHPVCAREPARSLGMVTPRARVGAGHPGIVLRTARGRRSEKAAVALYIAMGWCAVVAVKPLVAAVAPGGLALILAGVLLCGR